MEDRFGTPWPQEALQTYGIDHAELWVRGAARMVGKEELGEKIVKAEDEELQKRLKPIRKALKGKTIWIDGSHARSPALARVFGELGMKVVGMSVYNWDALVNPILAAAIEYIGRDVPAIVHDLTMTEIGAYLEQLKPDLFIGDLGMSYHALRLGIPSLCIQGNDNTGCHSLYRGAYNLSREAVLAIEMGSFPRSLKKFADLFTDEWKKGNPYRFMPKEAVGFSKKE
jgi:nitrogenase molybdenum-iron protein alpha/beta subunit